MAATTAARLALPARTPAAVAVGAIAGALWGVVARLWMRFISAEHEFSWEGTRAILIIFAIFGVGQAVAAVMQRRGRGDRTHIVGRVVAVVATLPMGVAAGAQMLPSTIVAAITLGRTGMRPRVRLALAMLAAIPTLFVLKQLVDDLDLWRAIVGWVLMIAVYAPMVWVLSRSMRRFSGATTHGTLQPMVDE